MRNIWYLVLIIAVLSVFTILPKMSSEKVQEEKKVIVKLNGQPSIDVLVGSKYDDEGFIFKVENKTIPKDKVEYQKKENVNQDVVGVYTIEYYVEYEDKIYELERTVNVIDETPPVITVNNEIIEIYKCKKETKNTLNYTAIDNYDGVITDKVKEEFLKDVIRLSVTDSSGNIASVEIPYKEVDDVKQIKLEGTQIIYTKKGKEYIDPGIKVYNSCNKEIKEDVNVINEVNTDVVGNYKVKYETNSNDKVISVERTVIVYEDYDRITNTQSGEDKIVYLTFDDGPGRYTTEILDILDKYNAKATFFVTNQFKSYLPVIKQEYDRGHTVAIHTSSHKWEIYRSLENYLRDFYAIDSTIYEYTGTHTKIFRFPGGASNAISGQFSKGVVSAISSHLSSKGYIAFDWNVDSSDAAGANKDKVVENVIKGIKNKKVSVVLMHDIKLATRDALEEILKYGIENGYQFYALDTNSPTIHHKIRN